jgi:hypothetical protein
MKLIWRLNLWCMAKVRKFDQLCIRDPHSRLSPELRIISERLGDLRRSSICGESGPVQLANHQRGRTSNPLQFVHYRLGKRHIENARLYPADGFSSGSGKHTGEHLDPTVVLRLPLPPVIDAPFIFLDAVKVRLPFNNQILIDLQIRRPFRLPRDPSTSGRSLPSSANAATSRKIEPCRSRPCACWTAICASMF